MSSLEQVSCNICGDDRTTAVAVQNGYRYLKCRNCGLVYMNPRPSRDRLRELYRTYHERHGRDENSWGMLMRRNFNSVSAELNRIYPQKGKLLDIGCGYGHFIELMDRFGWETSGIDPSPVTVESARRSGLNVTLSGIDEAVIPDSSFRVISLFYVLEHLHDPLNVLKKIYAALIPGGTAVLRIPDTTAIVRLLSFMHIRNNLYDAPFHLYDFSRSSARRILITAGFGEIKVTPGEPTVPAPVAQKIISVFSGYASRLLFLASAGSTLPPGVSKTVWAFKGDR